MWPRRYVRWVVAALALAAVAAFVAGGGAQALSFAALVGRLDALRAAAAARPWTAPLMFAGVYVGVTALSLPGAAVLSLVGAAIFGFWRALVVVSLASTTGAVLSLLLARFLFRDAVQRRLGARLGPINQGVLENGAWYLLSLRLVPAFPFWFVNLAMALTPMPARRFAWVSQLGMLPGTVAYVYAGTQLATLREPADALSPGVFAALAVLGLLPLAMRFGWPRIARRRRR